MLSSFSTVLPGQPIVLPPRVPVPQVGAGVYERDGQTRATVIGLPRLDGTVRSTFPVVLNVFQFNHLDANYSSCATPPSKPWVNCDWICYPSFTVASAFVHHCC